MKYYFDLQIFADAAESGAAEAAETSGAENAEEKGGETPDMTAGGEAEKTPDTAPENARKDELDAVKSLSDTIGELKKRTEVNGRIAAWEKEAEEMKDTYPSFDLGKELKNGDFRALLGAGVPLRRAYEAVNLEKILGAAMRYAAVNAGRKAAENLAKQTMRPQENGVLDRASSVKRTDVGSLTEKDIIRILGEVSRGAKISFG